MKWFKNLFGRKLYFVPTDNDVYNACLSYRHDYGLLSADQKIRIRREAVEWLIAWQKTMENNN